MKTIRCLLFALMLLAPFVCSAAGEPGNTSAMLDAMENGLTSRLGTVSGWDNVTGAPQVIRGKGPCHDPCLGMDIVSLDPGEEVYIRRPDRSMLRILPVDTEDPQPEVFFGTGSCPGCRTDRRGQGNLVRPLPFQERPACIAGNVPPLSQAAPGVGPPP